jgi:hypothetical protein
MQTVLSSVLLASWIYHRPGVLDKPFALCDGDVMNAWSLLLTLVASVGNLAAVGPWTSKYAPSFDIFVQILG